MWRRLRFGLVFLLMVAPGVWADTGTPSNTLTIDPSAVAGTTINAADENDRGNDVTTAYNAHTHTLSNTTKFGDNSAGNKSLCADAADATDRCLRWDDTAKVWTADQVTAANFNAIITSSGTAALTTNAFILGGGVGLVTASTMTVGSTVPAVFGDFSARAYNSGAEAVTSGTATIITLDSERYDTDTIHSTSSSTGRLTATTAGKYQISGIVEFAAPSTINANGQRLLEVLLNGATVIAAQDCGYTGQDPARAQPCGISTHYNLAANDYVELRVTQRVQTTLNINASANYSPEFEMVKVP